MTEVTMNTTEVEVGNERIQVLNVLRSIKFNSPLWTRKKTKRSCLKTNSLSCLKSNQKLLYNTWFDVASIGWWTQVPVELPKQLVGVFRQRQSRLSMLNFSIFKFQQSYQRQWMEKLYGHLLQNLETCRKELSGKIEYNQSVARGGKEC